VAKIDLLQETLDLLILTGDVRSEMTPSGSDQRARVYTLAFSMRRILQAERAATC
jgi:hypothetical protein